MSNAARATVRLARAARTRRLSSEPAEPHVRLDIHASPASPLATLTLANPTKHNAFSDHTIKQLSTAFDHLHSLDNVRALFVRAEGPTFCAGADLGWMRRASGASREANEADALALSGMLRKLSMLPCATVALVQGNAFGGGVGLISACDIAVGVRSASFALSEARLGLIPATIAPYVVGRITAAQARRYFLTAERFDAERAGRIGLLHEVVENADELDSWAARFEDALRHAAPSAVVASKDLIRLVDGAPVDEALLKETARRLSEQRASPEGREGLAAFLEKRKPAWVG